MLGKRRRVAVPVLRETFEGLGVASGVGQTTPQVCLPLRRT